MLLNDFYFISQVQQQQQELSCVIEFNSHHPIFGGHFPGNPVVPGVCMVEMVHELMARALALPLLFSEAKSIKFLQIIAPDSAPAFHATWHQQGSVVTVQASLKRDAAYLFKIQAIYLLAHTE
ncbi:MAG: hypothetical protein EBZ77_10135 [Chitinophagia bacterium]|nr:hypothetical protein [Chitinophagia bacterium]